MISSIILQFLRGFHLEVWHNIEVITFWWFLSQKLWIIKAICNKLFLALSRVLL